MAVAFVRSHTAVADKAASSTTVNLQISTATTPGNVLVAYVLFDNAATASKPTVSGIARAAGETAAWTLVGASRSASTSIGAAASGEIWMIRTSVAWPVATYAVTLDTAVTMKATCVQEFSGVLAVLRSTTGTVHNAAAATPTATTTGTSGSAGDLAIGLLYQSNSVAVPSGGVSWASGNNTGAIGTTGGNAATNNTGQGFSRILTGGGAASLTSSAALTAGNGAIVAILQAAPDPAITLAAYRFYADGTESGSTALAAQDTTPTVDVSAGDVNAQVRVRLQETLGASPLATDDWQLQWEKNASGTWLVPWTGMLDTNPVTAYVGTDVIHAGTWDKQGPQFVGDGNPLIRMGFRLWQSGANGTVTAYLYASSGAALGVGDPTTLIASSTTVINSANLPTVANSAWTYFDFASVPLTAGSRYFAIVYTTSTVDVTLGRGSVASHPGVSRYWINSSSAWFDTSADDLFEVYTDSPKGVSSYASPNLTDGAATTNRLTGGSGTFTAGEISETGLVTDLGWSGNGYTELLYSLTFKSADLTAGDTLRFRVLRNGATTGLTYTSTPTVTIGKGATATAPVASFTASASTVTAGGAVTFTDTSTNTPTTWAWNFGTGATPATASTQGPHTVTFSTVGTSSVTLTAGNAGGSDAVDTPTSITVSAPAGLPKTETLTDTFDTSLDKAVKWTDSSLATVWDASGRAKLPTTSAYSALTTPSAGTYDLTGSSLFAKMTLPAVATTTETFMEVIRGGVSTDKLTMFVSGTNLTMRRILAGVTSGSFNLGPYNATAHAWWRIRESGGTTYFDTSPDGLTWTNGWSVANGFAVTKVWVNFSSGWYTSGTNDVAYVDNVNVAGTVTTGRPKVYVAGLFQPKPGKVYMGVGPGWVEKPWKRWDGTQWKPLS